MPLVGSILVVGSARMSGGTFPCSRCGAEVTRAWLIQCALYGCGSQHQICGACLTGIQRFACANPDAARVGFKTASDAPSCAL